MSGSNSSDAASLRPEPGGAQPLGLTVHSLPAADDALVAQRAQGRWKMLAVMLICAAPVIASYFTYYVVRPEGRRSFGELIEPQRTLPDVAVRTLDGREQRLPALKGQWLIVSASGGACGAQCQNNLYLQRQLRETLGKEKDRVDWVWLVTDDAPVPKAIRPGLQQADVLRVPGDAVAQWLAPAAGHALEDHLYVVDPQGHWMMRFPARMDAAQAAKAKRDLERLLRASSSWDQPGR